MAKFEIVEGAPGQGKSLYTAKRARDLIKRNKKWEKKGGAHRRIASNIKFSKDFEEKNRDWIIYWNNLDQLHGLRNADIIWDEIATELDARNWNNLSPETMRMLSQYRKRGLDIYANTQDFSMVDARARLMITNVKTLSKITGSGDPSATKPVIKFIWGLVLIRGVQNYKITDATKKVYSFFDWSIMLIERELVELYDTTQDIVQGAYPSLRKIVRICPEDGYTRTTYV